MNPNQILKKYADYLDQQNIRYHLADRKISVRFDLTNAEFAFIDVIAMFDGPFEIFDYFGTCYTGKRAANRVAKVLSQKFPDYSVWVEMYTVPEIDVSQNFHFTTIEDMHERVVRFAKTVDEGAGIGKQMLGDDFDR